MLAANEETNFNFMSCMNGMDFMQAALSTNEEIFLNFYKISE
jgi:hypothetical protein